MSCLQSWARNEITEFFTKNETSVLEKFSRATKTIEGKNHEHAHSL